MEPIQFSHITTRGGDEGKTSLINGERRFKSELIFEVLGDIDELSSALGVFRSGIQGIQSDFFHVITEQIKEIQSVLVIIGGHVATPAPESPRKQLSQSFIDILETHEQLLIKNLSITGFILPGSNSFSASCDLSRAICRRAERHLVKFIQESYALGHEYNQKYLNRLSDYLFVLARKIAIHQGISET